MTARLTMDELNRGLLPGFSYGLQRACERCGNAVPVERETANPISGTCPYCLANAAEADETHAQHAAWTAREPGKQTLAELRRRLGLITDLTPDQYHQGLAAGFTAAINPLKAQFEPQPPAGGKS